MGTIGIIFLAAFVIICVLLISIVLIQNEEGGMGGLFGSSASAAFGSRSGNVLTRTTYSLVALFFVTSFILAFLTRVPAARQLDPSVLETTGAEQEGKSWLDDAAPEEAAPAAAQAAGAGEAAPDSGAGK
ncbi:MAG: preprotein translocase subunit SecG [Spirochaetaceae bacterium]|jgi:preprotein translocase subunit SecG|nr:preprotein translocase subunit SecG [Spirochaetaceae bacterium]